MTARVERVHSALVLVDFQTRLMPTIHDARRLVNEAGFLADVAHRLGLLVIATEQNPRSLGHSVPEIRERCDAIVAKVHFDGCIDGLIDALRRHSTPPLGSFEHVAGGAVHPAAADAGDVTARDVVIAGCEAHVCLLQTSLGLIEAGFRVFVVPEACGSRRPSDHRMAMQRLERAGAVLASAEMIAFEWLGASDDSAFRDVLDLIKRRAASIVMNQTSAATLRRATKYTAP